MSLTSWPTPRRSAAASRRRSRRKARARNGGSGGGTQMSAGNITFGGQRWPDIVGALHYKSGWGEAQISGVIHDVNVSANGFTGANGVPPGFGGTGGCGIGAALVLGTTVACNTQHNQTGWGIDAGVKFNLPSFGAGDNILATGVLHAERRVVLGYPGRDVGREWPGERQRPADVRRRRLLQPADQPVVQADRLDGDRYLRASLHPAVLPRPRRLLRPARLEQHGRRLQPRWLRLRHRCRGSRGRCPATQAAGSSARTSAGTRSPT